MKFSEAVNSRLKNDTKYQKIVSAVPDDVRDHLTGTVEQFVNEFGKGIDELQEKLQDIEFRAQVLKEIRKHKGEE